MIILGQVIHEYGWDDKVMLDSLIFSAIVFGLPIALIVLTEIAFKRPTNKKRKQ